MMPDNSRRFCTKQIAWLVFLVSQIACASLFAAPVITATKNDNVPAATKKPAGSTVTYKTTITNNGDVTGAGMNFTDPNVANTALTGSVKVTPIAQDDSFATVGNTQLLVNAAAGLLSNDHDPDSTTFSIKSGSVTRVSATGTANGTPGTFSVNANGSFTYAPGIGATGSERWQYIITDGDNQDCVVPGYVDFSITGRVWYVQAGAVGGKTGRSHEPFDSPAAASTAANASTDTIYVFSSGSTLNGAFILEDGQKLLGQGVDLTVGALTPFAAGVAPTLANTGGNTVTLGGSNTISGLVLGNRSGAAISGSTFGTLTVTSDVIINGTGQALNLSIGTLSATFASISASAAVNGINLSTIGGNLTVNGGLLETLSGDDFVINGGTLAVNYSGRITNTAGRSVNISNKTSSGDVTLNGRISDSGTGILLDNNDGATITLKSLGLNTGANTAFSAVNGGTVVVTDGISDGVNNDGDAQTDEADEANTLTTTTGTALNIANTNIGAAGLTFQSISVTGGSNGIVLNNTGAAGGLTVTGTGTTDGSGGTIQNTSTRGASFIGARNITLKNMNFTNAATADNPGAPTGLSLGNNTADNAAIHLDNVFNATLDNLNLNGSAEQGINGRNVTNFTLKDSVLTALGGGPDEDGIHFFNMLGTCAITNTFISGSGDDNINIQNNTNLALPPGMTATGTLAITGGNANTGVLGSGYLFGIRGTSNTAITISAVTSDNNFSGGIVADSYDTATMALEVSGSTITNNNDGIQVSASNGTTTFNIHDNLAFTGQDFACINLLKAAFSTGGTLSGSLNANPFTVANGRPTDAITVFNAGGGALNAAITNNTINYGGTQRAILIQAGQDGNGSIRTQVTGNTIDVQLDGTGNAVTGMFVQTSITSPTGDGASINAKIGGAGALRNTFTHSLGGTMAGGDIRVRQRMNGTFNLDGYGGGATDTAAVVTYLSGRNTTISSPTATAETTGFTGSATPAVPLLFASGEPEAFNFGTPDSVPSAIAWTETVRQQSAATPSTPATKAPETSREKPVSPPAGLLDQSRLDSLVTAARAQWRKSGLSAEQSAALDTVTFEVADLPGWYLGEASGPSIRIDNNAGGNGWFIDATPTEDSEFSNSLEKTDATGRVDLLTTIIHEMGHSLGLCDSYSKDQRGSVMYGFLTKGERRLPKAGEAASAVPHTHTTPHFLGAPINIANLPPGKSVVITYTVTIADPLPLGTQSLTSQGTVSGSNFADVLTDDAPSDVADPILPGNADPTVTLLDRPDTTVATLARASGSPTNANPVSWTVTFSDAIAGLTNANFLLTNIGLGGSPAISSVTPTGGAPATVWTVTASTGTSSGTLGLNLANDAALSHDVTNQPFTGPVYTIDRTAPDALIALSDTALKIGDTSLVTITFNEAVTGFTNADLTVPNGTLSSVATGDNITWTATLTPAASITDATNLITLDNTGMQDAAGNTGTGTTSSNNYAIDTARPTATIVVTDTNLTIGETSPVTITFSEPVTGFANADLTVGNGTLTAVTSGDGGVTWTATLTPTPNVTVANNVITLDNTGVQDLAGNTGTGTTNSNNYAVTSLSISIVANALSAAEGTGAGTTAFTFTVSRTGSTTGAVTMNYAVSGAAVNAADFGGTLPSGVFTIPDTQASAVLTILVSKDATREPNEAFTVTLSNPSGGYAITTATASSTIDNDDFEADLAITVTDGVTTAVPGGSVTYTITASNAGPDPAPAATLADTFPAALTGATWTAVGAGGGTAPASGSGNINAPVSLPVGGSVTFTVSATISPAAGGTLSNTASISSSVTDPVPANNSATDRDTLRPTSDLVITKTDGVTTATPGTSVTYTIVVFNAGPSDAGTSVSDTLPGIISGATWTAVGAGGGSAKTPSGSGNIFGESVILPVGGSVTYTVTAPISSSATGTLSNTATVSTPAGVTDPTPGNNSATDTDTLNPSADLSVTVTDSPDPVIAGNNLTYTVTVTNNGPSSAAAVSLADALPAGTTFVSLTSPAGWTNINPAVGGTGTVSSTIASLAPGNATFTIVAKVGGGIASGTVLSDTATISSATTDPTPGNNSGTTTTTVSAQADLAITKTDGVTTATPGTSVTYTITASNAGPSNVTGATVADTFPASISGATWTGVGAGGGTGPASGSGNINANTVNLPAGGSFTFTVTAPVVAAATGTLSNTATITAPAAVTDPNPANNSATDTDTLVPSADVSVVLTDSPDPVIAGNNLTYTVTVTNNGPSAAASVSLSDTLPSGTTFVSLTSPGGWSSTTPAVGGTGTVSSTIASLTPGSSVFTLVVKVGAGVAPGTVLSDTVTTSSATTDPTPANNSSTATTTVNAQADLAVTVTDSPDPVIAGNNLTYTITVTNNGPSSATSVSLNDALPPGTTFVSLTSPGGWSSTTPAVGGTGTVSSTIASLAPGSASFTLVVNVGSAVPAATVLSDTATVSSATTDPTPGNNSGTATTTVTAQADLAVTITDSPDPVNAAGNLTYMIVLTNNGPSTAVSPTVTLPLPASTTFVSAAAPGAWFATTPPVGGTGTVSFTNASLASGGTATFTVVAKVDLTVVNNSTLTATATTSSATTDPTPGNNSATTTTLAKSGADLEFSISASPEPVVAGTNLTYTFHVRNNGPLDAENVAVGESMPFGITFVSAVVPTGWAVSTPPVGSGGTLSFNNPLLANGSSATFTLVVKVDPSLRGTTILSNLALVRSTTLDIVPGNNDATATSTVTTQSDLAIQISGTPATAPKGSNVTYAITLTNNGPSDASAPNVSLPVPSQMTFVSATAPAGWSATTPAAGANGTVVFARSSLATGTAVSFTVVAKVKSTAPSGTILTATATATTTTAVDPVPANNAAASIASVGTVKPTAVQPVTTGIAVTSQTGLFDVIVNVTNTTPLPINGFRLHVNFNAYKSAFPSLRLYNASSAPGAADVYVDFPYPVAVDAVVAMKLSFYTSTRTFPSPFAPVLTVETLATSQVSNTNGNGVQPRLVPLADKTVLLEFPSVVGKWYRVRYSADMVHWFDCPVPIQAGNSKMQWIDNGPPFTNISPASAPNRFYIVNEIAAP